jgi:hypothetical protein
LKSTNLYPVPQGSALSQGLKEIGDKMHPDSYQAVDRDGSIIEHTNNELERLQGNLDELEKKLYPVLSMNAEVAASIPEEAPRNALHAVEIRVRELNNRLNGLIYRIEL